MKKISIIIFLIFIMLFALPLHCHAEGELGWSNVKQTVNNFLNQADNSKIQYDASSIVNSIADILTTIGIIIVLVGLMIFGIRYMIASPDEAAKIKGKLIGLLIAGVVILGAFGIWKVIGNILANATMEVKPMNIGSPTPTPTTIQSTQT